MWWINSIVGSPKQEHKTEIEKTVNNIGEFPEYFNDLFSKEKNKDATAQSKIENIDVRKILTPQSESHNPPANKQNLRYVVANMLKTLIQSYVFTVHHFIISFNL